MNNESFNEAYNRFPLLEEREQINLVRKMGKADTSDSCRLLIDLLPRTGGVAREAIIDALSGFSGEEPFGIISGLLSGSNVQSKNTAVEIMRRMGPQVREDIISLLSDPSPDVRKLAVDIIGGRAEHESVDALLGLLEDPDINVRTAAIESLGTIGDPTAVEPLIRQMDREENPWARIFIVEALSNFDDPQIVGFLNRYLQTEDPSLKLSVLKALCRNGDRETILLLMDAMGNQPPLIDSYSILVIGNYCRRMQMALSLDVTGALSGKIPIIRDNLKNEDPLVSQMSAYILSIINYDESIGDIVKLAMETEEIPEILEDIFDEPDEICVGAVLGEIDLATCLNPSFFINVLGQSRSPSAVPFLLECINHEDDDIRLTAVNSLTNIEDSRIEPEMIKLLSDPLGHIRRASAKALGSIRSVNAVEELSGLLSDPYEDVRMEAADALLKIGGKDITDRLARLLFHKEPNVRTAAAYGLSHCFNPEEYLQEISDALNDSHWKVRKYAVSAFSKMPGSVSIESIIPILGDENNEVKMKAVNTLCRISPPGIIEYLIPLLNDEDVWVRYETVNGLKNINDMRVTDILIQSLREDPSSIVKVAALESLSAAGGDGAMSAIKEMTENSDYEVRNTALSILDSMEWAGDMT